MTFPNADTLPGQLRHIAEAQPDRELLRIIAPKQADRVLTRQQFYDAARAAAEVMQNSGVKQGELVVMVQQDLLTLTASFFGAMLIGAVPSILPFATEKLDPKRYAESMEALLRLTQPQLLLADEHTISDLKAVMHGSEDLLTVVRAEQLLTAKPTLIPIEVDPEAVALLQHSSGTTGLQKGVALSHGAIIRQVSAYRKALYYTQEDLVVSWLPLYHDMGLIAAFLMTFLSGARLVLMSPFDWVRNPVMLLEAITEHKGTLCWLPNFAYNFMAQKIRDKALTNIDLSSMRAYINCSEPVYAASHQQFAERFGPYGTQIEQLTTCYGLAEAVYAATQSPVGEAAHIDIVDRKALRQDGQAIPASAGEHAERLLSSGRLLAGLQVRIVDDTFNDLPERRVGNILLQGDFLFDGYHLRPDATAQAFHEGWYKTGDTGYLADGELYILGRTKDLIIVGGKNIFPRDLEELASTVDGVHAGRVAAFGVPNQQAGTEDVVIVAEVDGDDKDERKRIMGDIRRTIAGGSDVPVRQVKLVERGWLIKTSSGKVARKANRDKLLTE